jgi:cytochrome c
MGRIDAKRHGVNQHDVYAHSRFERPQLLQPLPHFERGGRKTDKTGQSLPPVGIETDMMQERAIAPWRGRTREIEGAKAAGRDLGPDDLHHVGILALLIPGDDRRKGGDINGRIIQRGQSSADRCRLDGRQISLHIDDHVVPGVRVDAAKRLENAIRTRRMRGIRQDRPAPGAGHRLDDFGRIGRHHNLADIRLPGPSPDLNDHRQTCNVRQRFGRKAGGRHAGGDENERIHGACPGKAARGRQKVAMRERLLRVAKRGAIPVSNAATCRAMPSLVSRRGAVWRLAGDQGGASNEMIDSYEFNKIMGAVLGTLLFIMFLGIFSGAIYYSPKPKTAAYALPEATGEATAAAPAAAELASAAQIMANADAGRGAGATKQACGACHALEEGAASKIGPTLGGIIGRAIAGVPGFAYSSSLVERAKTDKVWNYENLNAFIHNPRGYASNTKMAYAGDKNDSRRGDILAYLRSISPQAPAP